VLAEDHQPADALLDLERPVEGSEGARAQRRRDVRDRGGRRHAPPGGLHRRGVDVGGEHPGVDNMELVAEQLDDEDRK